MNKWGAVRLAQGNVHQLQWMSGILPQDILKGGMEACELVRAGSTSFTSFKTIPEQLWGPLDLTDVDLVSSPSLEKKGSRREG